MSVQATTAAALDADPHAWPSSLRAAGPAGDEAHVRHIWAVLLAFYRDFV
jgi:hypothetical protein